MKKSHSDNNFYKKFFVIVSVFLIVYYFFNYNIKNFFINIYANTHTKVSDIKTLDGQKFHALDFEKQKLENRVFELEQYIKNASDTAAILDMGQTEVIKANQVLFNSITKNIIYSDIILNKGANDNVQNNSMVFVSGFKPIGVVSEAYYDSTKVTLFTKNKLVKTEFELKFLKTDTPKHLKSAKAITIPVPQLNFILLFF